MGVLRFPIKSGAAPNAKMKHANIRLYPLTLLIPALLLFSLFFLLPTLGGFMIAFTNLNVFTDDIVFKGFENFTYLFTKNYFLLSLKNTLSFAVFTTVLKTAAGFLLALGLNHALQSRTILRTIFYLPAVLSPIIIGIMFQALFRMDGLVNLSFEAFGLDTMVRDWLGRGKTAMGVLIGMEVWKWSGFNMAIFLAGMQTIPESLYEAARIDGTGTLRQVIHITVPLLMPAVSINMTSNIIGGLRVFDQVLSLTGGGPGRATQVINTLIFEAFGQGYYGRASAMGMILITVTLTVGVLFYRMLSKREVEIQ